MAAHRKTRSLKATLGWLEVDLQNKLKKRLGRRPDCRIYRQNSGGVKFTGRSGEDAWFASGVPVGASDLSGWAVPSGVRIEIEAKMPGKERTPEQVTWGEQTAAGGCIYVLIEARADLTLDENVDAAEREFERALAARLARGL